MELQKLQLLPEWYLLKLKADIEESYKVVESGCWEWQKGRSSYGYGKITVKNKQSGVNLTTGVHRVYYQLVKGFVSDKLVMSHECDNPPCINPEHLTPTTQWENNARGVSITAKNLRKTSCDNGHGFTPENTGVHSKTGWRYCRICSRKRTNEGLRKRTLKNNALGLNSKGKPFKREIDKKRSLAWNKHR